MKQIFVILLLVVSILSSCDGRERRYISNAELLSNNNQLKSFSEKIIYTPESYTEIVTDTILDNHFRIKLKYYSLINDVIKKTISSKDISTSKHYYSNFIAELKISKMGNHILDNVISKSLFKGYENETFWKQAIMQFVWIDYEKTTKQSTNINVSFCIPETNICSDFAIRINENGTYKIKKINLLNSTI